MTKIPDRTNFDVSKPAIRNLSEPERTEALDEATEVLMWMINKSDVELLGKTAGAAVARYLGRPERGSSHYIIGYAHRKGLIEHEFSDQIRAIRTLV